MKIMRKNMLVAVMMVFALSVTVQASSAFSDVKGHWGEDAIHNMVELGIVNGYPNGDFRPDNQVTRAEFIKMVVEAIELSVREQRSGEQWYDRYVRAAVTEGIHRTEDFNDRFDQNLTRMEMVRLAVRSTDETTIEPGAIVNDESFMFKAVSTGLIHGMGNNDLAPEGFSTRAQAITVIDRILKLNAGEQLSIDEKALENATKELERSRIPYLSYEEIWDEEKPHNIKLEVAEYYEMQVHETFYVNDGYLHGELFTLPEGFEHDLAFRVYFDPKDKVNRTNMNYLTYGIRLNPNERFSIKIEDHDKVIKMELHVGIKNSKDRAMRRFSVMDFYNNKEIIEYVKY